MHIPHILRGCRAEVDHLVAERRRRLGMRSLLLPRKLLENRRHHLRRRGHGTTSSLLHALILIRPGQRGQLQLLHLLPRKLPHFLPLHVHVLPESLARHLHVAHILRLRNAEIEHLVAKLMLLRSSKGGELVLRQTGGGVTRPRRFLPGELVAKFMRPGELLLLPPLHVRVLPERIAGHLHVAHVLRLGDAEVQHLVAERVLLRGREGGELVLRPARVLRPELVLRPAGRERILPVLCDPAVRSLGLPGRVAEHVRGVLLREERGVQVVQVRELLRRKLRRRLAL
mmetsp:Transcript_55157/g.130949  ORF Transcript_55157/g.130949 Transcript_55157/m.130949 type:complete len:285 (+) Transcript_55157:1501-2355(+)